MPMVYTFDRRYVFNIDQSDGNTVVYRVTVVDGVEQYEPLWDRFSEPKPETVQSPEIPDAEITLPASETVLGHPPTEGAGTPSRWWRWPTSDTDSGG